MGKSLAIKYDQAYILEFVFFFYVKFSRTNSYLVNAKTDDKPEEKE